LVLVHAGIARAAPVHGTLTLPSEPRAADARDGHWRVENGLLPVAPRVADPRSDMVIILDGGAAAPRKKDDAPPPVVSVELHGLRLDPRVVVAPVGATVEFKNSDRLPHTLYVAEASSLMPPVPTPAGQVRAQKFHANGEYRILDEEFPHVSGTVVVTDAWAAQIDEKGGWKLDVPEGHYTLRVYYRGAWALERPLDVTAHTADVALHIPGAARP
jgi:hypothetical protein